MSGTSFLGVTKGDAIPVLTIGTSNDDKVKDFVPLFHPTSSTPRK
jgi:hypothetical protein